MADLPRVDLVVAITQTFLSNTLFVSWFMATKNSKQITKKQLLIEIDDKIQSLNLLKSALQGDPSRKQEDLENYERRFYELVNYSKKK
ncbi:MAG TPA: hypothetical protein VL443_19065 [Cyclobacteriaceae bacterium]|nr:hypothetical protein [Cyclobacteriaceae bacterium]